MTVGAEFYRGDGSTIVNGSSVGGVFIEVLTIPDASTAGSKVYQAIPAGFAYCVNVNAGSHDFTIDASGGYARVNWTKRSGDSNATTLLVFARKVNTPETVGIMLPNDAGDVVADMNFPVPQYGGVVTLSSTADVTYQTPSGLYANAHVSGVNNFRPGSDRLIFVNLPDSGTSDVWYSSDSFISSGNTTGFTLGITVFAPPGVAYAVPSLHIVALNGAIASSHDVGMQLFAQDLTLMYDSGAPNVYTKDSTIVNYPVDPDAVQTFNMIMPANAGVVIPYVYRKEYTGTKLDVYISAVKRVGNQLTFRSIRAQHQELDFTLNARGINGSLSNNLSLVVDLAYFNPSTTSGTPNSNVGTAPVFTTQPQTQSVVAGSSVTLTVAATGNPAPTFQWQVNNVDISGATSASYSFVASQGQSGNVYRCFAINTTAGGRNAVVSNGATLTVTAAGGGGVGPSVTSGPSSQSVAVGGTASFSVSATGTAPVSGYWYKSGDGTILATGLSYSFTVDSSSAGDYYCYVFNNYGSATSGMGTLTVPAGGGTTPVISQQPQSASVTRNGALYLNCTASPVTNYDWWQDGSYVGSTTNTFWLVDTSQDGPHIWECVCYNGSLHTTSQQATVTVNAPSGSTFQSYPTISGSVYGEDENTYFQMYTDGSTFGTNTNGGGTTTSRWANGTGNASLYEVYASGSFTVASGSSPLNTWINLGSSPSWSLLVPPKPSQSRFGSLNFTVRLVNSSTVTSGTINFEYFRS